MAVVVSDEVMERDGVNVDAPTGQRDDGETMETFSDHTKMDPKLWNKLTEDLVEKIIARLPLKNIVQSQIFSKKWRCRFQSSSFQKQVNILSSKWGPCNTYHPLLLTEKGLCGYDRSAQKWRDLCILPKFPPDFNEIVSSGVGSRWRLWSTNCLVVGALVFSGHVFNDDLHIFVTNTVNKTIRRCPPVKLPLRIPESYFKSIKTFFRFYIHPIGHDNYKLVIFTARGAAVDPTIVKATVYDSKLNSWTEFQSVLPNNWSRSGQGVCVKGVVYVPYNAYNASDAYEGAMVFCTFDVEKGLFGKLIPSQPVPYRAYKGTWVALKSQLVLISYRDVEIKTGDLDVFTVDLKTLVLTEISRGPANSFHGFFSTDIVITDAECIYLILDRPKCNCSECDRNYVVSCDLSKQSWSSSVVDSHESGHRRDGLIELGTEAAFQPHLNPFLHA